MRRFLALSAVALFSAALMEPAFAHAAYESSDPDNGSTVSEPPSRVIADFTERLQPATSQLSVYDPCGTQVDNGDSLIANDRITVSMSADKQGTYVVRFQAHSDVDGHVTTGEFSFTSTGGQPCPGAETEQEQEEEEQRDPQAERGSRDEEDGSDDRGEEATGARSAGGGRDGGRSSGVSGRDGGNSRSAQEVARDAAESRLAAPEIEELDLGSEPTSIWDGIPIGDFLVSLAVAALIGAAGGRIYAGIVGPRR